jgi:hypothetical protein
MSIWDEWDESCEKQADSREYDYEAQSDCYDDFQSVHLEATTIVGAYITIGLPADRFRHSSKFLTRKTPLEERLQRGYPYYFCSFG